MSLKEQSASERLARLKHAVVVIQTAFDGRYDIKYDLKLAIISIRRACDRLKGELNIDKND